MTYNHGYGFTFIELTVTLAIIAVLALIAVPMAQLELQRGKERELRAALFEIREAIDAWKRASDQERIATAEGESGYPPTLDALVEGVKDQTNPSGAKLHFLRRLPRDPMLPRNQADPAKPWGLRSHVSPPDAPAEGDDVFDVYSTSRRIGLNGIPYNDW
ncbi:MAG: type II secretion system GspH family protein [Betaproteobacteria bacterium]|nr:type II secretion system GspH family protein [Betaproteobacteria bacterium]